MGIFDNMLKSGESLFINPIALEYDYQPKIVPFREQEMRQVAYSMKPLFQQRNGSNLIVFGPPGVGKTAACRHLLQEIEEQSEDIIPIYINCWQRNTSFKVILAICDALGYRFTQNKRSEEIFFEIKKLINKKAAVFVFDEIDKAEDFDFLYSILEEIYRKSVILIVNYKDWLSSMDERLRSRLIAGFVEFRPYNLTETRGILKQRIEYAFAKNVWEESAIEEIAKKTAELADIRTGLYLLKEAGEIAESKSSKRITEEHALSAIEIIDEFSIKDPKELEEEMQLILKSIKGNSGKKIGEIYRAYQDAGGKMVYKTFQRKVKKLEQGKFITTNSIAGGAEGKTTIISSKSAKEEKKLSDF